MLKLFIIYILIFSLDIHSQDSNIINIKQNLDKLEISITPENNKFICENSPILIKINNHNVTKIATKSKTQIIILEIKEIKNTNHNITSGDVTYWQHIQAGPCEKTILPINFLITK